MHHEFIDYLVHVRRQAAGTIRIRAAHLARLTTTVDLATATTADLTTWIHGQGWGPETINTAVSTLQVFYRWAHQNGRVPTNPAYEIRRVPVASKRRRVATAEQIARGTTDPRPEMRAATRLGAECGLRIHEIAKLHTADLDGEWLTIVGKGGWQRTVHASPELLAELAALDPVNGWFFPARDGGHVTADVLRQRISRTLGTNPHSLRHRAGKTVYTGTGNNLRVTQAFLGHKNPATTAIYVDVNEDDLRAAGAAARIAA